MNFRRGLTSGRSGSFSAKLRGSGWGEEIPQDNGSPPTAYFFLVLPSGISWGFASIALPFVLTRLGWAVAPTAALVAIGASSNVWRFVWSPIADMMLSTRTWYLIGLSVAAASVLAFAVVPLRQGPVLTGLVFFSQVAATVIILPVGDMIAHTVAEGSKGRASG